MLPVIDVLCPDHKKAIIFVFNAEACRDMFSSAQPRNLNPMELSELSGGTFART